MPSDQTPTPPAADRPHVGYVVKVYPRFSETFIVTEVLAREEAGEQLSIFALRPTSDARFHPEIARVTAPVTHLAKPVKLSDGWSRVAQGHAVLPGFAERFAALAPFATRIDATDVMQGIELAIAARDAGITHLHAHFASAQARVARIASGLTGIPYSVTTHAKDLFHESVDAWVLGEVLRHAVEVVAISAYNLDHLVTAYPEVADRVRLVRNGIDLDRFTYAEPAPVRGPLKVLGVGRLVEKKGFDLLVEAADRALRSGVDLEVQVAGDGELRTTLQAQVDAAGHGETIRLVGPRSQAEITDLLRWADVMVAPCVVGADGNADGLPTVLLEAMAMGVPCISTAVTGIPEAIHPAAEGRPATGVLLEPGDVTGLVEALRAVAGDDFPRVEIARAARALVEEQHDTRTQARSLASAQQQVAARTDEASEVAA